MPTYSFTARDSAGREQTGVQNADSAGSLSADLRGRGLLVMDVRELADDKLDSEWGPWSPARLLPATFFDVEFGLRQMASMLRSGITLLTALKTAADHARRPRMADIWRIIHTRVEEGSSFADALAQHPKRFPVMVIQLARTGEQSGTLDTVLERAADQLERQRTLRTTLMSALMYPVIVLIMALAVAAFMVLKVIPIMQKFLTGRGKRLPPVTQALIDVSDWFQAHGVKLGIGLVAFAILWYLLHRFPSTGVHLDRFYLRIPLIGKLFRLAGTALFARGLGLLLENGVTLIDALGTAAGLLGNRTLAARVRAVRESVLAGGSLARPLAARREFMPMLARMVAVGEESGTLGQVLEETARFHEAQLQIWVRRLSVLVEPAITVVVGGIVGFVYIAFFVALFSLSSGGR